MELMNKQQRHLQRFMG